MTTHNGNSTTPGGVAGNADATSRRQANGDRGSANGTKRPTSVYLAPPHQVKARSIKENASPADSLLDLYDGAKDRPEDTSPGAPDGRITGSESDENSKWIHRDKLAKIESEELQAAGFFLPRTRERARSKSQNRTKRDASQDKTNGTTRTSSGGEQAGSRSRKDSAATGDHSSSWDLRLPGEIYEEGDGYCASNGSIKASRIPVAKASPVPIPSEHLERETLLARKRDKSPGEDDAIAYPKPRQRSNSTSNTLTKQTTNGTLPQASSHQTKKADSSPKKGTPTAAGRKATPKQTNGVGGRPKTRGGPGGTSSSSGTARPSTRSGERELAMASSHKQMEGEPPWMVSAYRPDPRLPPDQQLLPTVAKRLQQEKWEREGRFGSVYDKEFRPLTDEGFAKPPEIDPTAENGGENEENATDWPLKQEAKTPPPVPIPARSGSYSTMPRISDKSAMSPVPSPRTPPQPPQPSQVIRIPEPPEEEKPQEKKGGCGCCIIM